MLVSFGDRAGGDVVGPAVSVLPRIACAKRFYCAINNEFRRQQIRVRDSEVDDAFRLTGVEADQALAATEATNAQEMMKRQS